MNNGGLRRSAVGVAVLALSFAAAVAADETGPRLVAVPGSKVVLKLSEAPNAAGVMTPHYAIDHSGQGFSEPRATSYDIKLRYGHFDPLGVSAHPEVPANLASGEDTNVYIVQYFTHPFQAIRDAMLNVGAEPRFFLANHCHIVKMDPDVVGEVESLPFVRWVGDFHPAYRLDPLVFDSIMDGEGGWQDYSIMVFGRGLRPQNAVAAQLRALGGTVMTSSDDGFRMTVTATPDMIAQIVRMDEVHFIDPWGPGEIDMDIVREIGGANYVENETGYSGEGVRGEAFDTGVDTGHPEWLHPVIVHEPGSGSHGTSCYGINFAQGLDPQARGLCPDGQGITCLYSVSDQFGGPRTRLELNTEAVDPSGPYRSCYQTASVGSPRTTQYTSISADTDNYLFLVDYLSFQSQSNAGDPMSRPQAWAKNICSVGGITHENTLTRDDDHHTGGSTGPAADGRIKPDLAHCYDGIHTTTSGGGYTSFGGTSGATPCTAGHAGLTMQMWHEGVFPGFGGGPSVFDDRPKSTTTKALLINHAYRYDWYSTPAPNPDINRHKQGWGMADIGRMYDQRFKMFIVNETEVLANLGSAYYTVDVIDDPSFRATMVYLDPPGNPASSQARINDLSLKVTSPSGTVYWGNNGLHTSNVSSPGGSPNEVDTTECVFVDGPEPGTWVVEVIAYEIVEDAHLETPEVDADFALVVSGVTLSAPCPADVDGSGTVDVSDLLLLLAAWGPCSGCPADIDGDGIVDVQDLLTLLAAWGPCPGPGACCFPITGLCLDMFEQSCDGAGGVFQGVGTECATTNCPQPPMGACCNPLTGECTDMIEYYCVQGGSDWQGAGTECATTNCPQPPVGACCLNYDCIGTITQYECEDLGGDWYEGEDCATFVCPSPCPGSGITTLYARNNGGSLGGAIYFDVTVGPNPLTITGYETNTAELVTFEFEVYITDPGVSYSGNETNPAAWTLVATGSGTGMGEDNPSPVWLDNTFDLAANTLYGMALVMGPEAGHDYTNGDGTNQFYSNADLELECGSATNVPFSGSVFSPRVWNGTMCYFVGP